MMESTPAADSNPESEGNIIEFPTGLPVAPSVFPLSEEQRADVMTHWCGETEREVRNVTGRLLWIALINKPPIPVPEKALQHLQAAVTTLRLAIERLAAAEAAAVKSEE